jgi:tRNA-specific 2-thiouridylase
MKVAVGLSGGVDSSVAAAVLKEKGYEVIGICMKIWDGAPLAAGGRHACYGPDEMVDIEDARQVAETLGIPFHLFDLTQEYKSTILDYFKKEYLTGRTPNPCIRCNQKIKFKVLLEKAQRGGVEFEYFATGHYAKVEYHETKKRYLLKKAKDLQKDQSYWLAFLSQKQLSKILFPLGDYTKKEVRKIAKDLGLSTYDKHDSQDFFPGDHKELLEIPPKPGTIEDKGGNVLGTHQGIWYYTIGQRKGLRISADKPLYVIEIDEKRNAVIVGQKEELAQRELVAKYLNCIAVADLPQSMKVTLKIRYVQKEFEGVISPVENDGVYVQFKEPQLAITPGQAVVFYDKDVVVGGGIIERYGDC